MVKENIVILSACLSVLINVIQGQYALTETEANVIYDCFGKVICVARNAYEFRRITMKAGPKLQEKSYGWFRDIYKMNARDAPEFWDGYPDIECIKPKKKRKEDFMGFMIATGRYAKKVCEIPLSEECLGVNAALAEGKKVVAEYTEKGVCENPQTASEKGVKDLKTLSG